METLVKLAVISTWLNLFKPFTKAIFKKDR